MSENEQSRRFCVDTVRMPEAWIQAEIYRRLRNRGVPCCPEYRIGASRYDIVVFCQDRVVLGIEVKASAKDSHNPGTLQARKYAANGIDVVWCMGRHQLLQTVELAERAYLDYLATVPKYKREEYRPHPLLEED